MTGEVRPWELVEHLFDASVSPERLDKLITAWDAQATLPCCGRAPAT